MENQAGLDGLAQAYLVGEQNTGSKAIGYLVGNVELVADQVDARATQPLDGGLLLLAVSIQRIHTQFEPAIGGQLIGQQAIQCRGQAQFVSALTSVTTSSSSSAVRMVSPVLKMTRDRGALLMA